FTALDNVAMPLRIRRQTVPEAREHAAAVLAQVGLADRVRHRPAQLSGGERQRVAIARAVVTDPAIILADEPTGNLDSKTGVEILDLFDGLSRKGATIILVTHDRTVAQRAQRIIHLKDGRIEREEKVRA
ncbi:MAG TPA: ATP-binding cassette domain-containing protein, partial [Planctomycetota bacterium]|nr:ATP-binding cassette domain-containing protein [Planctomycetota bacterium]